MLVHQLDHRVDGAVENQRVGVQQQDVVRAATADDHVVGLGKTDVGFVGDQLDLGKSRAAHGHAVVARIIVDHPHVEGRSVDGGVERRKTIRQEGFGVVIDYDDR